MEFESSPWVCHCKTTSVLKGGSLSRLVVVSVLGVGMHVTNSGF